MYAIFKRKKHTEPLQILEKPDIFNLLNDVVVQLEPCEILKRPEIVNFKNVW